MSSFTLFNRARPQAEVPVVAEDEKHDPETSSTGDEKQRNIIDSDSEEFTPDAQDGVKNVEAITSVWTKQWLIITYVMFVSSLFPPDV
jgi:hypothetical protein